MQWVKKTRLYIGFRLQALQCRCSPTKIKVVECPPQRAAPRACDAMPGLNGESRLISYFQLIIFKCRNFRSIPTSSHWQLSGTEQQIFLDDGILPLVGILQCLATHISLFASVVLPFSPICILCYWSIIHSLLWTPRHSPLELHGATCKRDFTLEGRQTHNNRNQGWIS